MNIGIYIENIGNEDQMKEIFNCVDYCLNDKTISDISVFYDNVGPCNMNIRCGFFNSTDLWNFDGTLMTTSIDTTKNALNIVNNIKVIFQYKKEHQTNLFDLLKIASKSIGFTVENENDAQELFRLTNKQPIFIGSLKDFISTIGTHNG